MAEDELTQLSRFQRDVATRMRKGQEEYGDRSFRSSPLALIEELKEEVLDIAGWGYVLWKRLDDFERRCAELDWEAYVSEKTSSDR